MSPPKKKNTEPKGSTNAGSVSSRKSSRIQSLNHEKIMEKKRVTCGTSESRKKQKISSEYSAVSSIITGSCKKKPTAKNPSSDKGTDDTKETRDPPLKCTVEEYTLKYTEEEMLEHAEQMLILFQLSSGSIHPRSNQRPGNYKVMVVDAMKNHYKRVPDLETIFLHSYPPRCAENLGYEVTPERNAVLLGWCQRLKIVSRQTEVVMRKKLKMSDGPLHLHFYLLQRYCEECNGNVGIMVVSPLEKKKCPLFFINRDEPAKLPPGLTEPRVAEPSRSVDTLVCIIVHLLSPRILMKKFSHICFTYCRMERIVVMCCAMF